MLVRQKKSLKSGEIPKGLGKAEIDLAPIINNYQPTEMQMTLTQCIVNGTTVSIIVTPKILGDVSVIYCIYYIIF